MLANKQDCPQAMTSYEVQVALNLLPDGGSGLVEGTPAHGPGKCPHTPPCTPKASKPHCRANVWEEGPSLAARHSLAVPLTHKVFEVSATDLSHASHGRLDGMGWEPCLLSGYHDVSDQEASGF